MAAPDDKPVEPDIREMFSRDVTISEKYGSAARDPKTGRLKSESDNQLALRLRRILRGGHAR